MNKRISIIVVFTLLTFLLVFIDTYAQSYVNAPNLIVGLTKQEPDSVEPGKIVEVSYKIDNYGTPTTNLVVEILPEYPFTLLNGESPTKFIGSLGTLQEGESFIIKYKLKVSESAVDGSHELKLRYKAGKSDFWVTVTNLTVRVQSHSAILAVERFTTIPAITSPGEKTRLRLELKNHASSILKDIQVSLNLEENGDEKNPFHPVTTTNERVIPYLEPQAILPIEFELFIDTEADSKAYKIPLTLKYSDLINKNYTKSNLITIIVGDKPDVDIALERTDIYTKDSTGNVVLRIVNKGISDIKFVNLRLMKNSDIEIIGHDEAYLGKLDSDDFSTAEFKLFINSSSNVKLPLEISYKDAYNQLYTENKFVELKLYDSKNAIKFGIKKNNKYFGVFIVIIILMSSYYLYKKRKRV